MNVIDLLTTISRTVATFSPSEGRAEIETAVARLDSCERGQRVLREICILLNPKSATGLDMENHRAFLTILLFAFNGYAQTAEDSILTRI